jgi:WD40 repeat protein
VTPDGTRALAGGGWPFGDYYGEVRIWELATGDCLTVLKHSGTAGTLALTPDGQYAVAATGDGAVGLWDVATGDRLETLQQHAGYVDALAVSPDGGLVVSGGEDKILRVNRLPTGEEVRCLFTREFVEACAAGPHGKLLVGDRGGHVYLVSVENMDTGPPIVTAWRCPEGGTHGWGCPPCRVWSEIPESALGTERPCPNCGKTVKLNPFTINADWRPIAAAWRGDAGSGG